MAPLAERSANRQSRIPVVGSEARNCSSNNAENVPPASNLSRLLAPTKSSVARSRSPSPSPIPLPVNPRTGSTTPGRGRLNTFTSNDSLNSSFSRHALSSRQPKSPTMNTRRSFRQSRPSSPIQENVETQGGYAELRAAQRTKPLSIEKPLPSRPVATFANSMSPTRHSRGIIDAAERPLIKAPGTPQEEEWPASSPERPMPRRGSAALSRTPNTRLTFSPAIVSPILGQLSTNLNSSHVAPAVSPPTLSFTTKSERPVLSVTDADSIECRPPRSSSLRTPEPKLGDSQEHKYLPAAHSFSRPRAQQAERSPASITCTPVPQSPTYSASKSPTRTPATTRITNDMLTFAGRHQGARSSRPRANTIKHSSPIKQHLALRDLPPSVSSPTEQIKLSPIKLVFGEKASADDVFDLLSSSFVGSTLNGARAPAFVSQANLTTPVDAEFDLPSPSEHGFHVSWPADFGFNLVDSGQDSPTVQSSPSSEESTTETTTDLQNEGGKRQAEPVHTTIDSARVLENREKDINTTLSILEGTPAKQHQFSNAPPKSIKTRLSMAKLPKEVPKDTLKANDQGNVRPQDERLPSYMLPTEARKNSAATPSEARRNNATELVPNASTRRASQSARLTPTPSSDKGRISPSGRQTPVSASRGASQSGRSTPTSGIPRSSQPGTGASSNTRSVTPTARPGLSGQPPRQATPSLKDHDSTTASANKRTSIGNIKAARQTFQPTKAARDGSSTPLTRPRSESKGKSVLNNLKGLFSGKRDVPPTPGSNGRRFSIGSRKSVSMEPEDIPDVPAVPAVPVVPVVPSVPSLPESRRKSTTKSILVKKTATEEVHSSNGETSKEHSILPRPRRKSTVKDAAPKKDSVTSEEEKPSLRRKASRGKVSATDARQEADAEKEKRDTVALMEMGLTLRQEAFKEDDLVRKERMTSFAQVMLDTVTSAVEAERNMYAAMQAAEQAKMSYMMTQQSVQEMNKLVSTSRRLPLFKKKKRPTNDA
ncbi:hypothetical protein M438DRAFT_372491 [Aureobasidium pullulans EXF-150]|uniref:Uncharacterized protein n=1 Tax=Aureobasidium pullulans EXF-150 TaxID=1043002 RepID=A0A074XMW6_AURPU|nr:uncharacterized protein M438DRAFT_372491 [Aureobasidium pullulans EXF-150]KEQ86865.1 hypothetical protein M438DRAFT_372491 [Aureobasidium pullulans EXF-150]